MIRFVILIAFCIGLCGCSRWDEAKERAECQKSNPTDQTKADECYNTKKQRYEEAVTRAIVNHH